MLKIMTADHRPEPSELVEVNLVNADYRNVCHTYGGGVELEGRWIELANILVGRPSWHFDIVNNGEALWSLGDFGGSNFNISVTGDGFYCYNHLLGHSEVFADIAHVSKWLEPIEQESRHFPVDMAAAFEWRVPTFRL